MAHGSWTHHATVCAAYTQDHVVSWLGVDMGKVCSLPAGMKSGTLKNLTGLLLASLPFFGTPWLGAEDVVELELAGTVSVQTQAGILYQPEISGDLQNWESWGNWFIGHGGIEEVQVPFPGEARYVRVIESPVTDVSQQLESLRVSQQLPGLAVVVIQDGRISAIGATGTRRHGTDAPVTIHDEWHHGSITKSMTATLAATMVEDGLIQWETTLGSVFPEKVASMNGRWPDVTLKQLLANASGAPNNLVSYGVWNDLWNFNGMPRDGRMLLLEELTPKALRFEPGTSYEYSNAGFALAGLMLETVANRPWEDLMRERLYAPLGMESGGFGVPATPRHLDHPVGHGGNAGNPTIFDPATNADNPPAIGPAATAHASILDLARYVQAHLQGDREGTELLPKATWELLHTRAFGNNYALGWSVAERGWAGGDALNHTGSNTQWFTNIWIAPEVNWACMVCTNFGGAESFQKVDQVVGWAISNYGP